MTTQKTARLPFLLVVGSLAGLILAPLTINRRADAVRREIVDVCDPARASVTRLQHGLSSGIAATRGFLLTGNSTYASDRRLAVERRTQAFAELTALVARLEPPPPALLSELKTVGETLAESDLRIEDVITRRVSRAEYLQSLPFQERRFQVVIDATERLDELLSAEIVTRRRSIEYLQRLAFLLTTMLAVLALAAALSVAHLGSRYRRTALQMEAAAEERDRLLEAERVARRESEEARREAEGRRTELEEVTASRAALIRGFSHDVRNPLGAAAGHLQLLAKEVAGPLTEKQRNSVNRATGSLNAALKLIEDLLTLAHSEAIEIEKQRVDMRTAVDEMAQAARALADLKHLSVSREFANAATSIETDPARVRQVLANLLSNAVKYTDTGGIVLRVGPRERDGQQWVVVDVEDTGRGIPECEQPLVFDEFQRIQSGRATSGAGIGLAISQRIAHTLGGRITVESEPGRGSVFSLWLPSHNETSTTTLM